MLKTGKMAEVFSERTTTVQISVPYKNTLG